MTLRRKNILLSCASFLLFVTGIFLCFENERFVTFIYNLWGLSFDVHFRAIGFYYVGTWIILSSVILFLYLLRLNEHLVPKQFYFLSSVLVIAHYFFHLSGIAINYPVYDDQGAILNFLVRYQNVTSTSEKIGLIFMPYNESVMAVPKLFVLIWLKIFGEINFQQLAFFNASLLLSMHLLFFFRFFHRWSLWFLIVTVLIFQFQFYDDAFWAISGLCYYGAFLFTAGCILNLLKKDYISNFISVIFALLATFTFGNGWVLFPMALLFLVIEKKFSLILPWIVGLAAAATVFYLLQDHIKPLSGINLNPLSNFLFVLVFLGSSMQFFYTPVIPLLAGIFVIASFIFLLYKRKHLSPTLPFLVLVYIILSAISASPLRSTIPPYGLQVRYGIFSILAIVICIVMLGREFGFSKKKLLLLTSGAFIYNLLTGLFFYPEAVIRKENIEVVIEGIKQNNFDIRYTTYNRNDANFLLQDAIAKGIYKP